MQPQEFFTQLKQSIQDLEWPSTNNPVFGETVYVVPVVPMKTINQWPFPSCFITDDGGRIHPQNNELVEQQFSIYIFNENYNDNLGESVMLGANKATGDETSQGKGILELEEVVIDYLIDKTSINSKKINLVSKSKVKTRIAQGNEPFAFRQIVFKTLLSYGENSAREEIQRVPGKLYINPPDISGGSYGTELGFLENGLLFDAGMKFNLLYTEDSGQTPTDVNYVGNQVSAVAEFMQYNNSTMSVAFNGMDSSGLVTIPGSIKTGKFFANDSNRRFVLLFVPEDTSKNKAIIMYRAIPYITNTIRLANGLDTLYTCLFVGIKDASGRIAAMGPIGSLPTP